MSSRRPRLQQEPQPLPPPQEQPEATSPLPPEVDNDQAPPVIDTVEVTDPAEDPETRVDPVTGAVQKRVPSTSGGFFYITGSADA
jgi:hypothetical protein